MFSKNMINYYFIFLSKIKPFDYVVDQEERKLNFVKNAGIIRLSGVPSQNKKNLKRQVITNMCPEVQLNFGISNFHISNTIDKSK